MRHTHLFFSMQMQYALILMVYMVHTMSYLGLGLLDKSVLKPRYGSLSHPN
jgi:hypothetical protein